MSYMFQLKLKFEFELSQSKRCLKRDKYCVVEGQSLIRLNLILNYVKVSAVLYVTNIVL